MRSAYLKLLASAILVTVLMAACATPDRTPPQYKGMNPYQALRLPGMDSSIKRWMAEDGLEVRDSLVEFCYRGTKLQATYLNADGSKRQLVYSDASDKHTLVYLDRDTSERYGWSTYFATDFTATRVYAWGLYVHLPKDYKVKNCE